MAVDFQEVDWQHGPHKTLVPHHVMHDLRQSSLTNIKAEVGHSLRSYQAR